MAEGGWQAHGSAVESPADRADLSTPEATSLEGSLALLFGSSHLGVVIADDRRGVLQANDAFLRMVNYSREEMQAGRIDWWGMTPEESRELDIVAIQQLREYGVCVPYEKEYILRDGSRLPFMMGAVRLTSDPLTWASYTVDLREHYKVVAAEQKARELQARNSLINELAHELNNPLAALTFLMYLISSRPELLTESTRELLKQANHQLERMAQTMRKVLTASEERPASVGQ